MKSTRITDMKKLLNVTIALMVPMLMWGQSYQTLWKRVMDAGDKDLPKTQCEVLQQIATKAQQEKQYGQLLKAELMGARTMTDIAPDSLQPAMNRLVARYQRCQDPVMRTVLQTVLWQIDKDNSQLKLDIKKPELTPELCRLLAQTKDKTYAPLVVLGADAAVFGHDMLSVIGAELEDYQRLRDYYHEAGNKKAVDALDAKLAVERYNDLRYTLRTTPAEKIAYIDEAVRKWGQWPVMNELRNARLQLTNPEIRVTVPHKVVRPMQAQMVALRTVRNVQTVTMTIYPVNGEGDIQASPTDDEGYRQLRKLLGKPVRKEVKQLAAHQDYEAFTDSMEIGGLPVGLYMVELNTQPATAPVRLLYHVTDVYVIAEAQPDGTTRYEVVSATTGQPLKDAKLRFNEHLKTVFAYTDTDKAGEVLTNAGRYSYYPADRTVEQTVVFTDRAIYRPGQSVRASALAYQVERGTEQRVSANRQLTFVLRDANYKVVAEKKAVTDDYGVGAVDFTLPATGLTGTFTIQVQNGSAHFRVEEYKRPTFHVDFDDYKAAYKAGDTLQAAATALSYAGVPVQEAKVQYRVVRRRAFWWMSYSRYYDEGLMGYSSDGDELYKGETTTDGEGRFQVLMPLVLPETGYTMFYNYVVTADVTDGAGETHSAQLALPLGNRETALSIDMPDKVLVEDQPVATFHLRNAAGQAIEAAVQYRLDGGAWQSAKTSESCQLAALPSGRHTIEVKCDSLTERRQFVVFSLHDERPATATDDWFYQSATQFPNDGTPVTIQVGSSDENVHIFYSIFAGKKVIEQGAVDRSNQLINRQLTYQETYGNGLLLTFAWVKNGHCYTHTAQIQRPLPDKQLTLAWSTFRDRLTPGQQETWTLTVKDSKGQPVDASMMATLYDQSLDQIAKHQWRFQPYLSVPMPSTRWQYRSVYPWNWYATCPWKGFDYSDLRFSTLDHSVYPLGYSIVVGYGLTSKKMKGKGVSRGAQVRYDMAPVAAMNAAGVELAAVDMVEETVEEAAAEETAVETAANDEVQVRENLNETAFFYPQLTTDDKGCVAIRFTLPEALTTWQLLGLAHTRDLCYGSIGAEAVARKEVMIQPQMPRFIREGDKATIAARIYSEKSVKGTARLQLLDAETGAIVLEKKQPVTLKAGETLPVSFEIQSSMLKVQSSMFIVRMSVSGKDFSDGEQHYLPVLPAQERVTVALPIAQHQQGTTAIDLTRLVPAGAKNPTLTLEYTSNPVWLMVQALPQVAAPSNDDAISLAAALYASTMGRHIIQQNPQIKTVFDTWKQEPGTPALSTQLEKNQELKELLLSETPWVLAGDNETEQKHRLADFFDENLMNNRLQQHIAQLQKLQTAEGAWTWYPGMPGSLYVTVAVSEMLVRLNTLAGKQTATTAMLDKAFVYMGKEMVELVKNLKQAEKKGQPVGFPSQKALQWLYLNALDGRQLSAHVQQANSYLIQLLKKDIQNQSIYDKALTAVILAKSDAQRAKEYAQSLKEYTVYREDMGRYYDTRKAGYSWFDYKIPTQTIAIEALQMLTPSDQQTIQEMQRWLLQQKHTQAWDTPVNSVNAVYAFLKGQGYTLAQHAQMPAITLDRKPVALPKATAALGYVKTPLAKGKQLVISKTTSGTSWGAVYAQFFQNTKQVADAGSGLTIKRELVGSSLKVGSRITVRLTITADRDYDFVQVTDKRAACMEPVKQLSGYHHGAYVSPRDNTTCYFYDRLSKGTHVIETAYYIDRAGTYETGTASVACAYAPEFRAVTHSETLNISK